MSSLLPVAVPDATPDPTRRFGGIARLYGAEALARLQAAHAVVVGVGGVGSWAAEALVRSGFGRLTLIDLDHVAESNLNRQLQALESTLGQAKVTALAARLRDINPLCDIREIEEFVSPDNVAALIPADAQVLLDCCDQVRAKASMAAHGRALGMPVVVSGAAGGKRAAHQVRVADLAEVRNDPLLAKLRYRLRRAYGAARQGPLGVVCVYSEESPGAASGAACAVEDAGAGLNCAGYGSSVMVTASFGMVAAGWAVETVARPRAREKNRSAPWTSPVTLV